MENLSALHCLGIAAQLHHLPIDPAQLQHQFGSAWDVQTLLLAAKAVGFKGKRQSLNPERLDRLALPAICPSTVRQSPRCLN